MFDWFNLAGAGTALAYLIEVTAKSVIVFLAAAFVVMVYRKASAADRHRIWFAALAGVILFPIMTAMLPTWNVIKNPEWMESLRSANTELADPMMAVHDSGIPSLSSAFETRKLANAAATETAAIAGEPVAVKKRAVVPPTTPLAEAFSDTDSATSGEENTVVRSDAPATPLTDVDASADAEGTGTPVFEALSAFISQISNMHWTTALFWVWLTGALLVLAQLITGAAGVLLLARRATPVRSAGWQDLLDELGDRLFLKRDVQLLKSRDTNMPMTWGGVNPVVLLPTDVDSWTDERRRCVITHELAHIKRWDCATQGIAQLACAIYWFNPFVWVAAKRLRVEREKACDDYVIAGGTQASNYANHLLEIARSLKSSFVPPLGAVSMARPSQLEGRVLAILDPAPRRQRFSMATRILIGMLSFGVILPLAAMVPEQTSDFGKEISFVSDSNNVTRAVNATVEPALKPHTDALGAQSSAAVADTTDREKRRLRLVRAFTTALSDEDPEIRNNAAHMLGKIGKDDSVDALGRALSSDPDDDVREQAAWGLGEIGSELAVRTLVRALADPIADVRKRVIWALGEIESDASITALVERLAVESDSEARALLVWSLGEIGNEQAVDALAAAFPREPDREVRGKIVWALGEIESHRAIPTLRLAASDEDAEIRAMAIWALTELEDPESIDILRRAVKDSESDVRRRAVWGLAELEDSRAVDALMEAAGDEDAEVRAMAVWGLGELEDNRALQVLISSLDDPVRDVQRAALTALGQLEDDRAVEGLLSALKNSDDEIRERAAWALGEIESERSVTALIQASSDRVRNVRKMAIWALSEIEAERSISALISAADDEDEDVREMVYHALTSFEGAEIEAAFIRGLEDDSKNIREMAAMGLSDYDSDRTVEALGRVLLGDSSSDVRAHAAHALGEIETDAAISVLEKALQDEDREVRKAASWALSRIDYSDDDYDRDDDSEAESHNPDYDSDDDIEDFAEAVTVIGEGVADLTASTVSLVVDGIASLDLGTIVLDATEQSLQTIDWREIEKAVEQALQEADAEIDESVVRVLIEIVEEKPDSRASKRAIRALRNSDHPEAIRFIRSLKG